MCSAEIGKRYEKAKCRVGIAELAMWCLIKQMQKVLSSAIALASLTIISSAQTITQNFGTGANVFSIDFVQIGNPGNMGDPQTPSEAGSISYIYNIGKYEISRDMILNANIAGDLGITMYDMANYGGNGANRPATGINWYEAAKFVNYLNTSLGYQAAYKSSGSGTFQNWLPTDSGYNASNSIRNSLAKYFLPSGHEWYKAAFGSPDGIWYDYATGSNTVPSAVSGGTDANTAVYSQMGPADVNNAGGLSSYGVMGMVGNVMEWSEQVLIEPPLGNWVLRGGSFSQRFAFSNLHSSGAQGPEESNDYDFGFRVLMIPEPSALSLLTIGLGGLAILRRRRS